MEELLTPKEARDILNCSLAYVYKLVERGHLPSVNFPNMGEGMEKPRSMVRLKRTDVAKFIEDYYTST
jgi:excisionase family DNA binding protein